MNIGFPSHCIVNIKLPCDPNDWSRPDGSCYNLKYPSLGTRPTAPLRLLKPVFGPNYEPAKTKSGKNFPLARYIRTQILRSGKASDLQLTQLVSYYSLTMLMDVASLHDLLNYALNNTKCCTPEGKSDSSCTPIAIPAEDPVHRFSGIRCMNITRPQSYQAFGCLEAGTPFARSILATPVLDLNHIYNYMPGAIDNVRTYENGLLKTEVENGKVFPTSTGKSDPIGLKNERFSNPCPLNELPKETRCHKYLPNECLSSNVLEINFHRYHNYIAQKLKELNPCWEDDRLFFTARDINIAIVIQIYYYEWLPAVFGRKNLIRDGIISSSGGFRDLYDENVFPLVTDEYNYALRYFHTVQEDTLKLYDKDGHFLKTYPLVNTTSRPGLLTQNNFIDSFIQGSFRQENGAFDHTIDYDMSERVIGGMLRASDVATSDLTKGRYLGLAPYYKYREFCNKRKWSYDDLEAVMSKERIHMLNQVYESVEDIELIAGIWSEARYPGSRVPHTVYCLMVEQLNRFVVSNRHWYERQNRPHAFTLEQLKAVRNTTIAGLLCAVGDGVTKIQPKAFYTISSRRCSGFGGDPEAASIVALLEVTYLSLLGSKHWGHGVPALTNSLKIFLNAWSTPPVTRGLACI